MRFVFPVLRPWASLAVFLIAIGASAADAPSARILMVGDSTMVDAAGWAPGFRLSWGPTVECINWAESGRSSKSYRDQGFWTKALATPADYLVLEFGGNDVPGKGPTRETNPQTTYRDNLVRYITEARARGLQPVLITSMAHRYFDANRRLKPDEVEPYVQGMREVARQERVPLVDLYAETRALWTRLGPEDSERLGRFIPDSHGQIKPDVHLSREGALQLGEYVARQVGLVYPELARFLVPPNPATANPALTPWESAAQQKRLLTRGIVWLSGTTLPQERDIRAMAAAAVANASLMTWPESSQLEQINRCKAVGETLHHYGIKFCAEVGGAAGSPADSDAAIRKSLRSAIREGRADEVLLGARMSGDRRQMLYRFAKSASVHVSVGIRLARDESPTEGECDFVVFDSRPDDTPDSVVRSHQRASQLHLTSVESEGTLDEVVAALDAAYNYQRPVPALGSLAGPLLLNGDHAFTLINEFYRYNDQRYFTNTEPAEVDLQIAGAPRGLFAEALRRDCSRETIVHLVAANSAAAASPITVVLRETYPGPVKSVTLLAPEGRPLSGLAFQEREGKLSIAVPSRSVYRVLVIAQ